MNLTGMQLISGLQFINGIQNPGFVDVLIVAGGGGGGAIHIAPFGGAYGGGGGAGGVITSSLQVGTGTHTVVVGGGGDRGPAGNGPESTPYRYNGSNSYISGPRGTTISYGGGMGAGAATMTIPPAIVGSGGGGNGGWNIPDNTANQPNYAGTPGQGFPGGIHATSSPAGGGGADQAGTPAGAPGAGFTGGKGGDGRPSWITGANVIYGGGGGGGGGSVGFTDGGGRGGLGGGGGGSGGSGSNFGANIAGGGNLISGYYSVVGTYENTPVGSYGPGAVNSGGGGGGGSHSQYQPEYNNQSAPPSVDGGRWLGGSGGSGIVVLRHPVASSIGTVTGGGNVLYDGSTNVVYVFTSSGTITWS